MWFHVNAILFCTTSPHLVQCSSTYSTMPSSFQRGSCWQELHLSCVPRVRDTQYCHELNFKSYCESENNNPCEVALTVQSAPRKLAYSLLYCQLFAFLMTKVPIVYSDNYQFGTYDARDPRQIASDTQASFSANCVMCPDISYLVDTKHQEQIQLRKWCYFIYSPC